MILFKGWLKNNFSMTIIPNPLLSFYAHCTLTCGLRKTKKRSVNVKEYLNPIYCCFNFLFDKFQWSSPDFFRNVLHSFFVSNVITKTRSDSYISGSHSLSSFKNKGFGSQHVPNTPGTNCYFSLAKYGWYRNSWSSTLQWSSGGGGVGTPPYEPYRCALPQRVGFLRRFGLKTGIYFTHFGLESGTIVSRELRAFTNVFIVSIPNE